MRREEVMHRLPTTLCFALAALFIAVTVPGAAPAEEKGSPIVIVDSHTRARGGTSSVVYLTIENHGAADDRLIGVSSAVAPKVEIRNYVREGDSMRLEHPAEVAVPAGGSVKFKRGGLHLKLSGLAKPLEAGKNFPMSLEFAKAGTVETQVAVQEGGARRAPPPRGRRRGGMY
jgi:copper(I)-binding protein